MELQFKPATMLVKRQIDSICPSQFLGLFMQGSSMDNTVRRSLLNALERNGGRPLIALLATRWARRRTKLDVEIFFDEIWMLRLGDSFLPRREYFDIYASDIENLRFRWKNFLREPIDHWTYQYMPKLSDVVFDIGAGSGTDTLIFSDLVGMGGKVYAFEAHPATFRRLQKTCKWNQLNNVVQVPRALWSEKGNVRISDLEQDVSNSVMSIDDDALSMTVDAIDLDAFVEENGIDRIDFLKMNIEGAERIAIKGMGRTIRKIKNVVIACHDFLDQDGSKKFASRSEVIAFLRDNNFEISQRPNDPRPYVRDQIYGVLR
jgi:FkbM family methyltransferase